MDRGRGNRAEKFQRGGEVFEDEGAELIRNQWTLDVLQSER